jgi:hypothetical protein
MPRERGSSCRCAHEAVAGQDLKVIARAMDLAGQRQRYASPDSPHALVLRHLLERLNDCLSRLDDYGLVIADEVAEQARHRADLSIYRDVGTPGYRSSHLTRIVDTLQFAPSKASRLLQAVDIVAFLYHRMFTRVESDERARRAKVRMWQRLHPRVHHHQCWFPDQRNGRRQQWGRDLEAQHKGPA